MKNPWIISTGRHVVILFGLSSLLIAFGTLGYMLIEGFSLLDALFMTVITLTTVGFGEVRPLDEAGRLFTIALIMLGAGFVAYNLAYFTQLLLDGNLLELYRRRKVRKQLEQLKNHYIICGYGQMGQIVARELRAYHVPIVIIENEESALIRLQEKGFLHLGGDATEEENLLAAGIERAAGLVSVVFKDTDNVFIVLTARDLNKDLFICGRASTPGTEKRLLKAGANRVVSPYASSALRIAHQILRPTVTDFLELALSGEGMELSMEEIQLPEGADIVGKDLMNSGIRSQYNLIIVAIKRSDGTMVYNPSPREVLRAGDILVAIGPQENLGQFGSRIYGRPHPAFKPC
ncbi:potassium channel family protein [Desulfoferrobacter suflitae]|uniref:potassium channel family protein n=1 Tax=Desulfoferrobacter suflitae TaxID=2865782 RepID=UPI00216490C9|nr:potassium channel protein [Desulfoferrobacter suflitae]MCK8602248.1 NAD-binding protein [Desulfoferrobacter suflitae]